jgi:hypothetical protein
MQKLVERFSNAAGNAAASGASSALGCLFSNPSLMVLIMSVALVNLVLYLLIVNWAMAIYKNKDCACGKDWRLKYIAIYPLAALVAVLVGSYFLGNREGSTAVLSMYGILLLLLTAGWLVFVAQAYYYVNDLVSKGCTCATSNMIGDEALQVYVSLKVAWWIIIALSVVSAAYYMRR